MTNCQNKLKLVLIILCSVGTLLILSWLLRYAHYGFDFTDEGFYLVWIANPFIYDVSIATQFGFVYHPIYKLLRGDIAALRQANILVTFGLTCSLIYIYFVSLAAGIKESRFTLLTVSAGIATSSLVLFDSWVLTPSYNSLNLQGLLIVVTGLLLAEKGSCRSSIIGWVLIGIGGWLVFMAKPSSALALAIGVIIYLLYAQKFSILMSALAVLSALALLFLSALLIDGSIIGFVKRIKLSIEFSKYLGGGHTLGQILRFDEFQLSKKFNVAILLVFGSLFIAFWSTRSKSWSFAGLLISIAFFSVTALLTFGLITWVPGFGQFQSLLIFGLVYAAVLASLLFGRHQALKSISSQQWAIAALLLVMPQIYAFGTINNYWYAGGHAGIFWLLAGLALLIPIIRECSSLLLALHFAISVQAVTAVLLQTGLELPYRQPQPLRLNESTLALGPQKSIITLSDGFSAYITTAMTSTKDAGFQANTPLIDLSGQSPGLLYAISAESIGQAWTIGGYSGSLKLAEAALKYVTCEKIAAAWVLYEPLGPRSIPIELMVRSGAEFPENYKLVSTWETAEGAGGYLNRRVQYLYMPIDHQKTVMSCQKLRNAKNIQ